MSISVVSYTVLNKNIIFNGLHKIKIFHNLSVLLFCNSGNKIITIDRVSKIIKPFKNPEYVPRNYLKNPNQEILNHLKWMLQKDILGQDMFLIGSPGSGRRNLVMAFSELTDQEIEYISLSRDTTEADLKQRKEIKNGTVMYHNQSAIRAAIKGRILIIEGIEKAERNILPILNNLLENREMHLENGQFLISASRYDTLLKEYDQEELNAWKLVRVSEDFKVIALGLPVPRYPGHPLDPPLRSRFQARHIPSLSFEAQLVTLSDLYPNVNIKMLSQLLSCCYALNTEEALTLGLPEFPIDNLTSAVIILENFPNLLLFEVFYRFYPYKLFLNKEKQIAVEHILKTFEILNDEIFNNISCKQYHIKKINKNKDFYEIIITCNNTKSTAIKIPHNLPELSKTSSNFYIETNYQNSLIAQIIQSRSNLDLCLIGPKGCGKSIIIEKLAEMLNYQIEHIVLYQDMTCRDLIQYRTTLSNGDTVWKDSPLITAALEGKLSILDGIHRLDPSTLSVISRLIHDRELQLYDGKRLLREDRYNSIKIQFNISDDDMKKSGIYKIHSSFQIIALAEPPIIDKPRSQWLTSEILSMFIFHEMRPLEKDEVLYIIRKKYGEPTKSLLKVIELVYSLRSSNDVALQSIGNSVSTRQLLRIAARVNKFPNDDIYDMIQRASLAKFLPTITKEAFEDSLKKFEIFPNNSDTQNYKQCIVNENTATVGKTSIQRYKTTALTKIPNILFYEIPQHLMLLEILVQDFILGENILLIGNQGVGKNKITDRLLQILNRPREYIQLHRDTTVQTLTSLPMIKNGVVIYKDSPLVQAVKLGHVLIVDEADKAPTHVTCILKNLVEFGEMILSDGRRIVKALKNNKNQDILLHPDFKMIVLANRPGFPFLGNDFFGTIGDVFSTHSMDNPDIENEIKLLKQYGPDINEKVIQKLVKAFSELRNMADQNLVTYPYSTREVINIIKHLQKFPDDSLANVIKNVFDFDQYSADISYIIFKVLYKHGISNGIDYKNINLAKKFPISDFKLYGTWSIKSCNKILHIQEDVIKYKQILTAKQQILSLDKILCTTPKFTELTSYWNLPISKNSVVVAFSINQSNGKLYILTYNPLCLYILSLDLEKFQKFNIDGLEFVSIGNTPQYSLTNDEKGNIFIHEERTNSLTSINLVKKTINSIQLSSFFNFTSNKISRILTQEKVIWKLKSDLIMSNNQLINFTINNNKIQVINLEKMTVCRMELPFKINSLLVVSCDKWLVQNTLEEKFMLEKTSSINTCPNILRKIDETYFKSNKLGSFLLCNTNKITSEILQKESQHKIHSSNRILVTSNTYANIITDFPKCSIPIKIFSIPRDQKVDSLITPLITERGDIIRIISSENVPKMILNNTEIYNETSSYIEITDIVKKEIRYIPLPISVTFSSEMLSTIQHLFFGALSSNQELVTVDAGGCIRLWDICVTKLESSLNNSEKIIKINDNKLQITKNINSKLNVNFPKHGKIDNKNEQHIGGNIWAGGTGGRDTSGLGGKGGPYRLDAKHTVYQINDTEKNTVPKDVIEAAREMGLTAFKKQLKSIKMSEYDHDLYSKYYNSVRHEIQTLKIILETLQTKSNDRQWCRNQTTGELDDAKLIEGLTGEKTIYRRLGHRESEIGLQQSNVKRLKVIVDVSGSMYRFNSYDGRLDREMEACIMVMEAFQSVKNKIQYDIIGHSGDNYHILFVNHIQPPINNKQRLEVIKTMIAHSQFCMAGDYTLKSTEYAISSLAKENSDTSVVVIFSDANLERYGIRAETFSKVLMSNTNVNAYAIFIGSLGDQAKRLKKEMPSGRAFVCMDLKNIPRILQQIFTASFFNRPN